MQVIPAIDILDAASVRLQQGDFERAHVYPDAPAALLERYAKAGARWVHVVDLAGARDGEQRQRALVAELANASDTTRIQVGGGIRDEKTVETLLDSGAGRIVAGSVAVREPATLFGWLERFGPEHIVVAIDVRLDDDGRAGMLSDGWTSAVSGDPWSLLERYRDAGLRHVLCTDVSRDGMLRGPNVALYQRLVTRFPGLALQASGGVAGTDDLESLRRTGIAAAITGKALLENHITLEDLAACWLDA